MSYAHTITVGLPYPEAVTRTREALAGQGFGVLSEIDVRATFEAKLGSDAGQTLGDYLILGVCNPALAQKALAADPDMGLLLPCNVVMRRGPDTGTTIIQTIDPQTMVQLSDAPAVAEVASDADRRLLAALKELVNA
ncbi:MULTISPECIES: DUF302 domain-containing protein [Paenarthrobacter]|jgi:uncharacterized protein (DUF302 family)|uniref:DUF302 domain-containing protein n=1 Tax=Paenarthrobacter ureafaciens TaxID=37931 RepID=A0AAX3ECT3_PAEUR|nr:MULTISPECIES: DUF302 domain-containing protein [Paenarthrobacter]NKR12319.1 ABC transporter [Arthrobacter sp. M5]NKR15643.1 ABC transporter [Arthrobacter sp. M6]OEH62273.1 ABC transporter [Arthrobacter sp. D4]OEH62844.1 ABC transporter [Arthrobacter sp. D2]MDO5864998.1 DUF302 domain-containing protein [Paenarthrobacter sp. SD-2]